MKFVLFVSFVFFYSNALGQSTKKVFITRPKNFDGSLIKFKLLINGKQLILPNNSYAELSFTTDSVKLEVERSPSWMKEGSSLTSGDSITYVSVHHISPGTLRKAVIGFEKIDKECYEANKSKSRKKIELLKE